MPLDWTDGEDRAMAEWRNEGPDAAPPPCPNCDGPLPMTSASALCDGCRAAEAVLAEHIESVLVDHARVQAIAAAVACDAGATLHCDHAEGFCVRSVSDFLLCDDPAELVINPGWALGLPRLDT
jgi:hypothetical protein